MSIPTEDATKLQRVLYENYHKLKEAEQSYYETKIKILAEYDKMLEEYQTQNPNIPIYVLWKKNISTDSYTAIVFTTEKCHATTCWSVEKKLKDLDLDDLRKLYPMIETKPGDYIIT